MNVMLDLEYSLILLFLYIIIRSTARNYFDNEKGRGTGLLMIFLGVIIFIFVSATIGIIAILGGVALMVIPDRKETKNELIKEK